MLKRLQESKDQLASTSLSSSWHSSSLTFVSSQNHQQPSASARPLEATRPPRFTFPSRVTMAKIITVIVAILIVMVVVGLVVADDESAPIGRPRAKTKALSLRKKKLAGNSLARLRVEEVSTSPAPVEEPAGESIGNNNSEEQPTTRATPSRPLRPKKPARSQIRSERPSRESNAPIPEWCGECDQSACKNVAESSCHVGVVLDRCSCCLVCGSVEGNRCYNSSIASLPQSPDLGICGSGLACMLRKDLDPIEPLEALCECRDKRLVCGSDNKTYSSECKLREIAHTTPGLSISSWGPCITAPWMPSAIENVTISDGEDASLSCEVKGFPSPVIHWEFLAFGSGAAPVVLPEDDSSVVVTIRGGPEQTMSTSWIQIIAVGNERQGTYFCIATNSRGVARNAATVTLSRSTGHRYAENDES